MVEARRRMNPRPILLAVAASVPFWLAVALLVAATR